VHAIVVGSVSERLSALVVLRSPVDSPTADRVEELMSDAAAAAAVREYFRDLGFDVGPLVGVSFSIDADRSLFESTFGSVGGELDLALLPSNIREQLQTVTFTEPPAFGPERP
jgi:hypothetical protein